MSAFTPLAPRGGTPIISNKKGLDDAEPFKRTSGTLGMSNNTSKQPLTLTSSLSSISSKSTSSQASPEFPVRPSTSWQYSTPIRVTSSSSFLQNSLQASEKTIKMGSSPKSVMDVDRKSPTKQRRRKTRRSRKVPVTSSAENSLDWIFTAFIAKCGVDKCAGQELADIYEDEYLDSEEEEDSMYSADDLFDRSVDSGSYMDSSFGTRSLGTRTLDTQSATSSRQSSLFQTGKIQTSKASTESTSSDSRSNSLLESADNSLIDSTDEFGSHNEESAADDSLIESILSHDLETWADITAPSPEQSAVSGSPPPPPPLYKKLTSVGIQLLLNEHNIMSELSSSVKRPGLLFLKMGQVGEDPHLVWEDLQSKKSHMFGLFDIISIDRPTSLAGSKDETTAAGSFCVSLKDNSLLFFEAADEVQMTGVVQALKEIAAGFTRQMILGDCEQIGKILQNKNVAVIEAIVPSLTDSIIENCLAGDAGQNYEV